MFQWGSTSIALNVYNLFMLETFKIIFPIFIMHSTLLFYIHFICKILEITNGNEATGYKNIKIKKYSIFR